jgi:hypothetical protein
MHDCAWAWIIDGFAASSKVRGVRHAEVEVLDEEKEREQTRLTFAAGASNGHKHAVVTACLMYAGASPEAVPTSSARASNGSVDTW